MFQDIKVSIIIPAYNAERYLRQALDSAVQQTLPDVEVICVDDGSVDGTTDIIKEYENKYENFNSIYFKERRGTLAARVEGVKVAKGQYMMFLDADDYLSRRACELAFGKIQEEQVDIVHFITKVVNCNNLSEKKLNGMARDMRPLDTTLRGYDVFKACYIDKLYEHTSVSNKIFRSEVCQRAIKHLKDGFFPRCQDFYMYFFLTREADSYYGYMSEPLYYYCAGRGVYGAITVDLEQFDRLCSRANVISALVEYAENQSDGKEIIASISDNRQRWFHDCFVRYERHLVNARQEEIASVLLKYWSAEEIVEEISAGHWEDQSSLLGLLRPFRQKLPLPEQGRPLRLIFYYNKFRYGGIGRVISVLMPLLLQAGHQVLLVTREEPTGDDYALPEGVERRVIYPPLAGPRDVKALPKRMSDWRRIVEDFGPDYVLHNDWADRFLLWDVFYLQLLGVKCIVHAHSCASIPAVNYQLNWRRMLDSYELAAGMACLSEADRFVLSAYNSNVHFIHNPIAEELRQLVSDARIGHQILWVGRFELNKRPWLAIEIMRKVVEQIPDAHMIMLGNGVESIIDRCKALCQKYRLEKNITFAGYHVDVEPYWQRASLHLLTSEIEGYSMVLIEAKAHGVPTVMDDLSYLATAQPQTGVTLVPGLDAQIAADSIVDLMTNEAAWLRESEEALAAFKALEKFDHVVAWEQLLRGECQPLADVTVGYTAVRAVIKHHLMGIFDVRAKNEATLCDLRKKHAQEIADIKKQGEAEASKLKKSHVSDLKKIKEDNAKHLRRFAAEVQGTKFIYGAKYAALVRKYKVDMIVEENSKFWGEMMMGVPVCSTQLLSSIEQPTIVFAPEKHIAELQKKYHSSELTFLPIVD
ncbi:MAG: glycosyltransferase [Selenomonas sp.]|nr:glycosyltransferase [Selenomonas sp.]